MLVSKVGSPFIAGVGNGFVASSVGLPLANSNTLVNSLALSRARVGSLPQTVSPTVPAVTAPITPAAGYQNYPVAVPNVAVAPLTTSGVLASNLTAPFAQINTPTTYAPVQALNPVQAVAPVQALSRVQTANTYQAVAPVQTPINPFHGFPTTNAVQTLPSVAPLQTIPRVVPSHQTQVVSQVVPQVSTLPLVNSVSALGPISTVAPAPLKSSQLLIDQRPISAGYYNHLPYQQNLVYPRQPRYVQNYEIIGYAVL